MKQNQIERCDVRIDRCNRNRKIIGQLTDLFGDLKMLDTRISLGNANLEIPFASLNSWKTDSSVDSVRSEPKIIFKFFQIYLERPSVEQSRFHWKLSDQKKFRNFGIKKWGKSYRKWKFLILKKNLLLKKSNLFQKKETKLVGRMKTFTGSRRIDNERANWISLEAIPLGLPSWRSAGCDTMQCND